MKFLSDILAKAGLTVDGVVTLNNTATGQTPNANDNSTKLATTAWVRTFVQPYSLPIASASTLGGIKVGDGLSIDSVTGVLSASVGGGNLNFRTIQEFTATAGQTTFTITGGYTPGYIEVLINGVYVSESEYTASNGTTVVLDNAVAHNDIVTVFLYSLYNLGSSNYARNISTLTATAGQTVFNVTYIPGQIDIFYNGSKLSSSEFTATNGTTVTLVQAAVLGDILEVVTYLAGAGVNASRTLTINGVSYDLSSDRSWTINNASLGAQPQLNGTGLVRMSGTTVSYDNATYATQTYVTTAISNLVNAAPATLDTLNELAAALGNDAAFSTTVTNSIATKQAQLNGTGFVKVTGTTVSYDNSTYYLASNPSGYLTASTVLNAVLTPYTVGANTAVTTTDTIETAIEKLQGQVNARQASLSGTGFVKISGTTISYDNSTYLTTSSASSTYLPLVGGILTGGLTGTTASFSSFITAQSTGGSGLRIYGSSGTNQWDLYLNSTNLRFSDNTGTGSVVFDRPISGTSATFTSNVIANAGFEILNGQFYRARRSSGSLLTDMIGIPSGTDDVRILTTGDFNVINGSLTNILAVKNNGNIGIVNTDPQARLHIGAALLNSADATNGLILKQTSTNETTGIYLERSAERKGYYIYVGGSFDSLNFQRNNAGTKSDTLTLTRDGHVGINQQNPTGLGGPTFVVAGSGYPEVIVEKTGSNARKWGFTVGSDGSYLLRDYTSGANVFTVNTSGGANFSNNVTVGGNTVWTSANDGSGSGLDADLLDGRDSGGYMTQVQGGIEFLQGSYTGWYKLARSSQATNGAGGRGSFKIIVAQTGNYLVPSQDEIKGFKDWGTTLSITSIESTKESIFQNYRLTYDADYTYLEGYVSYYFGGSQSIVINSYVNGLNGLTWSPYTGTVQASSTSTGALSIGKVNNGLTVPYLRSAGGIQFGSGTSTLNYYEEGTFTPTPLSSIFSSATVTFGRYVRIGNQVTVNCKWEVNPGGTGRKYFVFNLPFAFNGANGVSYTGAVSNYDSGISAYSSNVGTTVRNSSGSDTQQYVEAVFTTTNSTSLQFSMTYFTF